MKVVRGETARGRPTDVKPNQNNPSSIWIYEQMHLNHSPQSLTLDNSPLRCTTYAGGDLTFLY